MKFIKLHILDVMIIVFVVLLCAQQLKIVTIAGFSLKAYHVFSLLFIPILIKNGIKIPDLKINLFFLFILFSSLISAIFFGFSSLLINYLYCYYIIFIFTNVFKIYTLDKLMSVMKISSFIVALCIWINPILNINRIVSFISNNFYGGHPSIPSFFGGGVNLDATWPVVLGACFIMANKKQFLTYFALITLYSLIVMSRTGLIGDALLLVLYMWYNLRKSKFYLVSIPTLLLLLVVLSSTTFGRALIERFTSIGESDELGSMGRINMWQWVGIAFKENIMGYGTGNCMKALMSVAGYTMPDGNLHNLYFQYLIDNGILGFLLIIFILMSFICIVYSKKSIFAAGILLYLLMGFLQFRGGDALIALMFSVYCFEMKESNFLCKNICNGHVYNKSNLQPNIL